MLKKISKKDWQYLIPFLACALCFIATDFLGILEKSNFAYWSGGLVSEPYRIITSHFIHGDVKHLLANTFGIIIARYCLTELGVRNSFLFLLLIILLIPIQTLIFWLTDMFIFKNPLSLAIGFSGILYGVDAFILLASTYGKNEFMHLDIGLKKNHQIRETIFTLTCIGFFWSLLPGVSMIGHLTGFFAGAFLFLL